MSDLQQEIKQTERFIGSLNRNLEQANEKLSKFMNDNNYANFNHLISIKGNIGECNAKIGEDNGELVKVTSPIFDNYVNLSFESLKNYDLDIDRINYYKYKILNNKSFPEEFKCQDERISEFVKLQMSCDFFQVLLDESIDKLKTLTAQIEQPKAGVTIRNRTQSTTQDECVDTKDYNTCKAMTETQGWGGGKKSSKKRKASKKNRRKTVAKRGKHSGKRKHSARKNT